MTARVHLFKQASFLVLKALDGGNDIAHLILALPFVGSDPLRIVDPLSKFTFASFVATLSNSTLTHLASMPNQFIFLCSFFGD